MSEFSKCKRCNALCCSAAGAVMVTIEDTERIGEFLGESYLEARNNYTHAAYDKVDGRIRHINKIVEDDEYAACVFKGDLGDFIGCTIYEARPEICRMYSEKTCTEEMGVL